MENIKLYINANIDDVKNYIEKLIDFVKEKYPKFDEIYSKMIYSQNSKTQISYWSLIYDKLSLFSNLILNKDKNNRNAFINTILFLLFGIINITNKSNSINISLNIEQYKNSLYSNEIMNFRNCITIILIQLFINNDNYENNSISEDNKDNENNKKYFINTIIRIVKSSYIKKCIHVIKSLLKKNIENENSIFILSLFYYMHKNYKNLFIDFLNNENCDIKKEYKIILIKEYELFKYNETDAINYSNKIFEIKLSYSLLGLNPKNEKINLFLNSIIDKRLKEELLEVFQNYYYNLNNNKKNDKLLNVLKEVRTIKKNLKEIKNNIEEMKLMQNNSLDDIFRILNIINKP